MKKNKVILIMPGEIGLYLKDRLPAPIFKLMRPFFNKILKMPVVIPLALLTLGAYFKRAGFDPVIIDARVEDPIERLVKELDDRVVYVGFSALTGSHVKYSLMIADHVRKVRPNIPLVWGGVHVTLVPEQSLRTSDLVDVVVRGEGEITGVELAQALSEGMPLEGLLGIGYKDKTTGNVVLNEERPFFPFTEQLDIDYSLVDMERYDNNVFLYQSERGCPHRCSFCDVLVVHKRTFRKKTGEQVLEDLKRIHEKFKPGKVVFVDDCFFADFKRARIVIDGLIKMNLNMKWHASCRAQYFSKTDVDFWKYAKQSGLDEVYVGTESGSQEILDYINKDCTLEDILNGAEQIDKAGIIFMTNLMCGFPKETIEDVNKSLDFVDKLRNGWPKTMQVGKIFLYAACPGTPLHFQVVAAGFKPPRTLYGWGQFRIGHRSHTEWHPNVDYLWAVSVCSMYGHKFRLLHSIPRLKRLNIPGFTRDLLGHLAYYRWKYRYFKYPFDLKLIQLIDDIFYSW